MGCRNGEAERAVENPETASGNALLLATISSVGLPVEVQVKDGSLYSGVFHTASVDDGYGIVLKKAMVIKKGRWHSDLEVGALVDTLVVLSNDLVQLIVKDSLFPMEGDICSFVSDRLREGVEEVDSSGTDSTSGIFGINVEKKSSDHSKDTGVHDKEILNVVDRNQDLGGIGSDVCRKEADNQSHRPVDSLSEGRQAREIERLAHDYSGSNDGMDSSTSTGACEDHLSSSSLISSQHTMSIKESHDESVSGEKRCSCPVYLSNGTVTEGCRSIFDISVETPSSNGQTLTISTCSSSVSSDSNSSCSNLSVSPDLLTSDGDPFFNTCTKESKLNPEAKLFFPSSLNARSASTVVPNIVNTSFASNIPPAVPFVTAPTSFENSAFPSSAPLPAKFVQYCPLVAGQTGINTQYLRHNSGQVITRQQPTRFCGQYHPTFQTGVSYMHQHAQPVMVGRAGQLVYLHPVYQDPMQGTAVLSQGYSVLTPCEANIPKFEGIPAQSLQYCMSQPLMTSAPVQPFAVPSPVQFSPIPAVRPIAVQGGNGFFGSKYQ